MHRRPPQEEQADRQPQRPLSGIHMTPSASVKAGRCVSVELVGGISAVPGNYWKLPVPPGSVGELSACSAAVTARLEDRQAFALQPNVIAGLPMLPKSANGEGRPKPPCTGSIAICRPACSTAAAVLNGTCVGRRSVLCRAPSAVGCLGCVGVWRLPVARTFHEDGAVTTTYVRGPRLHFRHCTGSARILDVGVRVDGASETREREG